MNTISPVSHDKPITDLNSIIAELEYKTESKLGEGAFWNHQTQELYWIDIEGKKLFIYNPQTGGNRSITTPSRIGTVVPKNQNEAVVALEDGIYILNLKTEEFKLLANIEADIPSNRFNDGKADPRGRLWAGTMDIAVSQPKQGSLYMIEPDGKFFTKRDSISVSNGIVWTKDMSTLYYIDTPTSEIVAFDYNADTGEINNERVAVKVADTLGHPDGMAIDENDKLWVGMWNGNSVIQFDPISGELLQKIKVPAHNVTSCAFGGPNLKTLYITTASVDMTDEEKVKYPLAGSLFRVNLDVSGVKSTFFGSN